MTFMVSSSSFVCSRSGSITFWPTLIELKSAPPWKATPILRLIADISNSSIWVMSFPSSRMQPEVGRSSPSR